MSMFRRKPRQPRYGPKILEMRPADSRSAPRVNVRPLGRGEPRVLLQVNAVIAGCECYLTEDEVHRLAQALFDGIDQSKALTAGESG